MSDQPPSWFMNFMKQIAGTDGSVEASSDSSKRPNDEQGPPPKIAKTSKDSLPPSQNEEDDEFDRRFGHLFNSNLDDNNNNDDDYDNSKDNGPDNDHDNSHENVSINIVQYNIRDNNI